MKTNTRALRTPNRTHEGAPAYRVSAKEELRRAVSAFLLWENQFYESGTAIADRITSLVPQVQPADVATLAVEARTQMNLRHAPLFLVREMCRYADHRKLVADTLNSVILRADELAEFVALYWEGKCEKKLNCHQVKRGLARAFTRFNAYNLAKYNRDGAVKLRDVLFLCHAKPKDAEQASVWKRLVDNKLAPPDTWEVALSAGEDKKATWERLLAEDKLGYLALLRNLRNMDQAGVPVGVINAAIEARQGADRVFPFRYVAAARACPKHEPSLDKALVASIGEQNPFDGVTCVLVDVSGSMEDKLSAKSDMKRIDAAAALASIIPGERRVFTFSQAVVEVPPRVGMAGVDAIIKSQPHGGTYLGKAVAAINANVKFDRLIVVTDEQSHDQVPAPKAAKSYMINVASYQNGVGYGPWTHINGWSESIIRFIRETEQARQSAS